MYLLAVTFIRNWQVHLLAVTFRPGCLATLWGSQLDLKLPVPSWIATATHTGCPEHLCAVPDFTVGVNLLHVGHRHASVPAAQHAAIWSAKSVIAEHLPQACITDK